MDAKQAAEPRVSMSREEFDAILAAKDAEIDFERGLTDKARETIERLAAEFAELRRDAERYRWLRSTTKAVHFNELWEKVDQNSFDAAVDAALAAQK